MSKYKLEDNIDFYKELNESLYEDTSNNSELQDTLLNNVNDENITLCLITNKPLSDNFVELKCGHKFNYDALYKDMYNYKRKFNNLEQIKNRLKTNQIRCPYCRNVQNELLPYYEHLCYPKEYGINYYKNLDNGSDVDDEFNSLPSYNNQCQFQISNKDMSGNEFLSQCHHFGYVHFILKSKYNNTTKYCYSHKLEVIKNIKKDIKEKIKAAKLEEKLKKIDEKIKKLKETLKSDNIYCSAILKTGKKVGLPCNVICFKTDLCKRHFKLQNKQTNENIIIQENIVI